MALELQYGEVVETGGAQIRVKLSGYEADVALDVKLLQPGGFSSVKSWIAPQAGDCVAVLVDTERPEDSIVLGGVYTDARGPIGTGATVALQAPRVYIGSNVDTAQKATRDDHVQTELAAIKAALDALVSAFNDHIHGYLNGTNPANTAVPTNPATQTYTVGDTAADSVYVK